jgi:uncharacterized membrane protein
MKNLTTTIASYSDLSEAEQDWISVESAASAGSVDLADAALIEREPDGTIDVIHRQSHHGWGKGAVAGAVVGVIFPPSIIYSTAVGAGAGALVARMNRSLDKGDIKALSEVMDSGEIALVALAHEESTAMLNDLLSHASRKESRSSSTAEEVQRALSADDTAGPTT